MVSALRSTVQSDILVIDQDPKTAQVVKRVAAKVPASRVRSAPDVLSALRLACQEQPAIILLDGALTDMDRVTGVLLLKAHPSTRAVPVVVMTPGSDAFGVEAAFRAGAHAHVVKPLQVDRITDAMQATLVAGQSVTVDWSSGR